jgi:hypothetical protein
VTDFDARARRVVAEHIFEDLLSGSVRQGQNITGNGIEVTGEYRVTLVDYGVLKERARIIGLLKSSLEGQNEYGITMFGGRMHWTAVLNHTVADFIDLIEGVDDE